MAKEPLNNAPIEDLPINWGVYFILRSVIVGQSVLNRLVSRRRQLVTPIGFTNGPNDLEPEYKKACPQLMAGFPPLGRPRSIHTSGLLLVGVYDTGKIEQEPLHWEHVGENDLLLMHTGQNGLEISQYSMVPNLVKPAFCETILR